MVKEDHDDDAAEAELPLQEQFRRFHLNHRHVYKTLVEHAREAKSRGMRKVGMARLLAHATWEEGMSKNRWDGFKMNNGFHGLYARLILLREADLAGILAVRELRAAGLKKIDVDAFLGRMIAKDFGTGKAK